MSNIDTLEHLKSREVARKQAQEKINTQFVLNSYPTVTITNLSGQIKTASVVNKQESDIAYFYVEKKDSLNAGEI
jgi:hypothetical protein